MFKNCYCCLMKIGEYFQSLLLLAIRLYWGFGFFESGYGKLSNIAGAAQFFDNLGIPFSTANAYIAGSIECFGGLLLMAGLFSRIAAIPLIIVMLVAYGTAHSASLVWSQPGLIVAEAPFNFLLAALLVFAFGPGKISLDYLICKLCFQKKCASEDNKCPPNDKIGGSSGNA